MQGNRRLSRCLSATAYAVVIATSLGSAAAEGRENRAIESIDRYCRASWRNARIAPQDWEECTQQAFVEMLERVSRDRWAAAIENKDSRERRELNRSIWCVAQRWRRAPKFQQIDTRELARDNSKPDRTDDAGMENVLQMLSSPEAGLSARQQDVMQRWLEGSTIAEIAADLDLPPARVSDEKYKAIQKVRTALV